MQLRDKCTKTVDPFRDIIWEKQTEANAPLNSNLYVCHVQPAELVPVKLTEDTVI